MDTAARQPLAGVRIVDLADGIAGGYAAKLLADAGAEILAIESPAGDPLRLRGATAASFDAAGDGLLFRYLRTGQRALVLDLDREADRSALLRLYGDCDAVLDSRPAGWLDARGLGASALAALNPRASWLSLSAFGNDGPWAERVANDFTLQAWCGSTASRGRAGLPPLTCGGEIVEWLSGTYAALGVVAALRAARRDARGAHVSLSKLEAITPTLTNAGSVWGHFSQVFALPASEDVPSIEPTADGWIGFCIFTAQQWKDFSLLVEHPEWADDPTLAHMAMRHARADEIRSAVRAYTREHTTEELLERSEWLRVPAAPIGHGALLPKLDHLVERGVFVRNPRGGFLQPRVPYASTAWPRLDFRPAPTLAEAMHAGANVAAGTASPWTGTRAASTNGTNGASAADRAPARDTTKRLPDRGSVPEPSSPGRTRPRPLEGLRVLDLTAFWAGPYATFVLGCLGADVIHVESIQRPDGMRFGTQRPPTSPGWWEFGPTFHSANTGKRGLTLDLTRPRGLSLLLELAKQADVVIENFSPRVLDNFGLDYAKLAAANPRIVLVRMPAFGLDGPWRNRVGFAQTMEQVSGIAWRTAYPASAGEKAGPLTPRACADPLAGLHAAYAALLGLAQRDATGEGCMIESAMVETLLAIAAEGILEHDATGTLLTGDGNRSIHAAPQGLYACAGVDALDQPNWLALSVESDAQWSALVRLVGRTDWQADPELASLAGRRRAHDRIDEGLARWLAGRAREEAVSQILAAGIPCAPVSAAREGHLLEPIAKSDFIQEVDHPLAGRVPIPTQPLRFHETGDRAFPRPAPLLGEHNAELLRTLAGLGDAEIEGLRSEGIVGERPSGL
ncbi:MAG: CoA transferase [Deltaproteobacteria bacterium]|nr:CoA transferase [Deltaproteobacteria bacterium]